MRVGIKNQCPIVFPRILLNHLGLSATSRITAPGTLFEQLHLRPAPVSKINKIIWYVRKHYKFT